MQEQIELIEEAKKELKMTQSDLAKLLEVGEPTISEWANGKRRMKVSVKLALKYMIKDKHHQSILKTLEDFATVITKIKTN